MIVACQSCLKTISRKDLTSWIAIFPIKGIFWLYFYLDKLRGSPEHNRCISPLYAADSDLSDTKYSLKIYYK